MISPLEWAWQRPYHCQSNSREGRRRTRSQDREMCIRDRLDTSQFGSYKIWLAHYTNQTDYSGRYNIWQYTSGGSVPGIPGKVDMNVELL